uniref:tRNA nucleotidyltransferase/poly(A) polymerase n=1 Tax=Pithovirus LCPAC401 TaxID=2506595 RepID=A0A481ZD00_9VIRU|nr:MAG: tRNA nucleotidyltransferase/poly(A) polymerase [Pithovirus LCPAC401]
MGRLIGLTGFDKDTFTEISTLGVIAGGSVVYALNDFVPEQSVGDVDIFVFGENKKIFNELSVIIRAATGCLFPKESEHYWEGANLMQVVTFENSHGKSIQLILSKMKDPQELVSNFTLDYVRCYFHKGMFGVAEDAQKSHMSRTITLPDGNHDDIEVRIQKALKKGFEVCDGEWEFSHWK